MNCNSSDQIEHDINFDDDNSDSSNDSKSNKKRRKDVKSPKSDEERIALA